MPIQEGKPIWNESICSAEEWKENLKKYPGTCHIKEKPLFFKSDYEWRWRMGAGLYPEEITTINNRLDEWRKMVKNVLHNTGKSL